MIEYKTKKEEKSANKTTKIGLVLFAIVIAVGYFVSGENDVNFTVEDFWKIENGMTYEEVTDILNDHGSEISKQHESPKVTKSKYQFISDSGGFVWVSFVNGEVVSKMQVSLKKEGE